MNIFNALACVKQDFSQAAWLIIDHAERASVAEVIFINTT
jgi:hypothetical protein